MRRIERGALNTVLEDVRADERAKTVKRLRIFFDRQGERIYNGYEIARMIEALASRWPKP